VKENLVRATSGPYNKDLDSFVSSASPVHRNPYCAASRSCVVHPWGNHENAAGNRVTCPLVRLCASIPLVVVGGLFLEDLSRTLVVETTDEIVPRVLERTCPHLVRCRSLL